MNLNDEVARLQIAGRIRSAEHRRTARIARSGRASRATRPISLAVQLSERRSGR